MKIRSYKGTSLADMYDAVHTEMGPDAIVVKRDIGGILNRRKYELIAIVDDASANSNLIKNTASSREVAELSSLCATKLSEMTNNFDLMQRKFDDFSAGGNEGGVSQKKLPGFMQNWDPRFVSKIQSMLPELAGDSPVDCMSAELSCLLNVQDGISIKKVAGAPHVIAMVGPTGVGKTTTLAKLAANLKLEQGFDVGIITTDTYRVAAVDQIREYATLLGLELRVVFSAAEAGTAVRSLRNKDVILVDTPGRSHFDETGMASLKGMLQRMGETSVCLLLPAILDYMNTCEIIRRFSVVDPDSIILTKTDETNVYPLVSAIAAETAWPICFVTDGQRVPQDMHIAKKNEILKMLTMDSICPARDAEWN